MIVKVEQIKKALEGMAQQWKSCEGDLARQDIDSNVKKITSRYCESSGMMNDMRRYYETLKWERI